MCRRKINTSEKEKKVNYIEEKFSTIMRPVYLV